MTCDDESLATFLPQMTPEERVELCSRLKSINFWGCLSHTSIEAAYVPCSASACRCASAACARRWQWT